MAGLPLHKWATVFVLLWCVVGLLMGRFRPAVVFLSGVVLLMLAQVVQPEDFLESLSNPSIVTIFLLIFITAGDQRTL